jgi:hypothetical protein
MRSEFGGEIASAERHERDSANGTPRRPPAESGRVRRRNVAINRSRPQTAALAHPGSAGFVYFGLLYFTGVRADPRAKHLFVLT